MWSKEYECCKECKGTEIKHTGKGYCLNCYPKMWWKKQSPEKYKAHLQQIKDYQKTKNGREACKRARKNFLKNHPDYYSQKFKDYREQKKKEGLCTWNGCNETAFSECFCKKHLLMMREQSKKYYRLRRKKNGK